MSGWPKIRYRALHNKVIHQRIVEAYHTQASFEPKYGYNVRC
jgi:hypothetical protein